MAFLTWTKAFSVGIGKMDEQHQILFGKINDLHDAMMHGKGQEATGTILAGVAQYTVSHFAAEEALMELHHYPDLPAHREEHKKLIAQVTDLQAKFKAGTASLSMEVMTFLQNWLNHHINGSDKKYGVYLNGKGVS